MGDASHVAIVGHGVLIRATSCEDPNVSAEHQCRAVAALAVMVDAPGR